MPTHDILPGVNALGCGFNPFDTAIEATKRRLFTFDYTGDAAPYSDASRAGTYKSQANDTYSVPKGVMIDPAGSTGAFRSAVFQRQSDVEDSLAAEAHASGGFGLFRAEVNASYAARSEGTQSYSFASGTSEITLWTLSLARDLVEVVAPLEPGMKAAMKALPRASTSAGEREAWDDFFATYGTHYISGCRVGGFCRVTAIVRKSSKMTSSTIKAQLEIEYGATFKGGGSAERSKQSKAYQENSEKQIRLSGGDTTKVGQMENDPAAYVAWTETIRKNPANRGYTLREIWKLFEDKALQAAAEAAFEDYCYRNSTYALSLSGKTSYVDVQSTKGLDLKTDACFEAWIYPTGPGDAGNGGIILNKDHAYEIDRQPGGMIRFALAYAGKPSWAWVPTGLLAPQDVWTHVAISFNSSDGQITATVNGQSPKRFKREGALRASANKLWIGARPTISHNFQGFIEEVRVWNVARSVAEVQAGMFQRMTGAEDGLVGLWPLNDATKDLARDRSRMANMGKLRDAGWSEPPRASPLTLRAQSRQLRTAATEAAEDMQAGEPGH